MTLKMNTSNLVSLSQNKKENVSFFCHLFRTKTMGEVSGELLTMLIEEGVNETIFKRNEVLG